MVENNRKPIASLNMFPQFTTMNVIDGQAGVIIYSSLICHSLTIDNILNIIVILILAGVTIATLTGDNGLLQKTQTASEKNTEANALEKIKVEVAGSYGLDGKIDKTQLIKNLKNIQGIKYNNSEIDDNTVISNFPATVKLNGYTFKIPDNGNVEKVKIELPKEYQQVEYIESTGTQYINTNLNTLEVNKIKFEIFDYISKNTNDKIIFGYSGTGKIFLYNGNMVFFGNQVFDLDNPYNINTKYNFVVEADNNLKQATVSNDGNETKQFINFNNSFRDDLNISLFGAMIAGVGGVQIDQCSVSRFKITIDELLVRDFIPCYSITTVTDVDGIERPSNTIGMYDKVEGKFYVNKGTGTFLKGDNV